MFFYRKKCGSKTLKKNSTPCSFIIGFNATFTYVIIFFLDAFSCEPPLENEKSKYSKSVNTPLRAQMLQTTQAAYPKRISLKTIIPSKSPNKRVRKLITIQRSS